MTLNTFDRNELNHFKIFSARWWDTQGPFEQLHAINPLRIAFLREKISIHFHCPEHSPRPLQGLHILDVGCGGGLLCEPLTRLGANVTGIDLLPENIDIAKAHAEAMGLSPTYLTSSIEDLPEELPPFDVIIASEIIEHITDQHGFLKACVAHLKPHGGMFISTFNRTFKSYLVGIVVAEYILRWAPQGTHTWDKFISPQDLARVLASLGLGHQDIAGLSYSLLRRGWELSTSTDVNYFLWASRKNV